MALESANYIDELVSTNPLASDNVSQGDNQLRLIKKVLKQSFPSVDMAVNAIHASDSAPAVAITAGLIWFDTSANLLKIRNEANDAWVTLAVSPVTSNSVDINAGTVDGAIIGGSSAAAGTFTTLTANTSLTMAEDATIIFEGATDDAYETTLTVVDPTADRTVSLPNATDTLVGLATTDTLTNKTLTTPTITSPVVNTGISGTAVLDSDTMSGASATTVATSESIKAYVDAQVTAQDLDITTDSGSIDIDLDSESLTISGGEGIDTSATGTTVTIAGEEASTSNKGVASFSSDNFSVSSGAVTIKDAGVANAELADMAANTVKVRNANSSGVPSDLALATTEILIGDGTGFTAAALSGDVTMANTGAVTIASGAVENSMLADMAANTVKVRDANSSGAPSDKAVADTQVLIGDGTGFTAAALSSDVTMTNAGVVTIADNAVSLAKMAGLARGKIIYGDSSGDPAALAVGSANYVLTSDGTDISWAASTTGDITAVNVTSPITGGGSSGAVTIAIQDASTSAKGAASFSSDNFAASSGAITIKDAGVANAELANMAANTVKVRDANSSGVPSDKAVADTQILIGDGTGFTAAALSGDVTMANTGAVTIAANSVDGTMIALGSDAQGDVMYYNGTNWARLGYGTDGHFLKTQGASANPVWAAAGGGGASDIDDLSDALVENNSIWLGSDPSGTTDTASYCVAVGIEALDIITTGDSNVAIGYQAADALTTGAQNTAVGTGALSADVSSHGNTAVGYNSLLLTTGEQNTAVGLGSLDANVAGSSNNAFGYNALGANTSADRNVAVGHTALGANTTGASNAAVGMEAMLTNTTGSQCTAFGNGSLRANTTASYVTAYGGSSLYSNTTGAGNTALGYYTLNANTTGANNVAIGNNALDANTTAGANIAIGVEALGDTTTGGSLIGIGYAALGDNTTGHNSVAIGYDAARLQTTGYSNVAIGSYAMDSATTAHNNTMVGHTCGQAITTGNGRNVGMGQGAFYNATTGYQSAGVGQTALFSMTTGYMNAAFGCQSLDALTTAIESTAVGYDAGSAVTTGGYGVYVGAYAGSAVTTGASNTIVGHRAGDAITTGAENTAIGLNALGACTTGSNNAGVSKTALMSITTSSQNTGVGAGAGSSATTTTNCFNGGYSSDASAADASNEYTMGNASISNLRCNDTSISSLSDRRDKTQIEDLPVEAGLEFINNLKPVTFYWDRRSWYDNHTPDGSKVKPNYRRWKANSGQRMGFISQDVQEAIAGKKCLEDSNMVSPVTTQTDNGEIDGLEFAPAHLITPLIKAVQQLSAEVEALKAQLGA